MVFEQEPLTNPSTSFILTLGDYISRSWRVELLEQFPGLEDGLGLQIRISLAEISTAIAKAKRQIDCVNKTKKALKARKAKEAEKAKEAKKDKEARRLKEAWGGLGDSGGYGCSRF